MRSASSPSVQERNGQPHHRFVRMNYAHGPPVLCTFNTLSLFPESGWNAFTSGVDTANTAHCPYVGDADPLGSAALMTD